ncbi:unnamed protein product [Tuber aestivum]|uniref:Uncharacterized protein n=1 Tax=Tuber aestivum TaxID=59557 RepID=A0A292PQI0_9PEZI|nr:unnamed protein product [Tuber aestivum]
MSRRRSRLPSTIIASSSTQILSVGEFLKGLHRTPRKSRSKPTQTSTPATATKAIPSPEGSQEDGFLLETLAALEKADEETTRPITKRRLGESVMLETRFPKKRRKKRHVAYNSLTLSRDPQDEISLSLCEAREDSEPDPILSGITQTDNPVPIPPKPRYPVSVIRGSIVSPWSQRGRNLTAAAGQRELRMVPHEKNWGDRIDSLLVPGKARARGIGGRPASLTRALELSNMTDRTRSPAGANKFPHFVSPDSQFDTLDCSPPNQGLVGTELGPELGFFQAPLVKPEIEKPAVAVQPVSQHFKRICTIASTKLPGQTNRVASEGRTAELLPSSGVPESGPNGCDQAGAQDNTTEKILPWVSPSLIGSDITVESGRQGGSMAKTFGYPWERFDRSPTPFPSPEPGIAPQGSDCSSLLRFWESQLPGPPPSASPPGGDIGICISSMQEPKGSPQFRVEEGTKNPSPVLEGEVDEGNSLSSSAQLWEDYQLGNLELTSPLKQPPRVVPGSPKSMPWSGQPAQARTERVMLPPPFRQPRKPIDGDESEDNLDYINEIPGGSYFSNAQKMLDNCEDARLTVLPIRSNRETSTTPTKGQLGSRNVPKTQPPTHSLSPLSTPTPARTYNNIPLKDIIKRRETVPLRRLTISGSFKSPFLPKPAMTNMDQAPTTSGLSRQGQKDRTMSIANPNPFTVPAPIVPSPFVAEPKNRVKRRMTGFQSFSLPTGTRAPGIGARRATQGSSLQLHRGMTIRFEHSQKPFKPPLMTKPLQATLRTSRQPSGFDAVGDNLVLVNPRRKVVSKAQAKSGRGKVGVDAQCAGMSKAAMSSFLEVQAAW